MQGLEETIAAASAAEKDLKTAVLREIRRAKSEAKVGMKAEIETVTVTDSHERIAALEMVVTDVRDTGKVAVLIMEPGDEFSVVTVLAPVTET